MLIPKSGDFIKHKANMDVAIYVQKAWIFENKINIQGIWANQGFVQTQLIGLNAKVTIDKQNISDWLICSNPNATCIRDVEWRRLT